jgi:DNA-binding MarR family transcriptional regulator
MYDLALAPCGISIGQFGLLATLAEMEGESISKLAETLQMERTTLTRNLSPLQMLGYVVIEGGPDKRSRALTLTDAGKKALRAATPKWRAAQRSLERRLGVRKVSALHTSLDDALKVIAHK